MNFKISPDRRALTIIVDKAERQELRDFDADGFNIHTDDALYDFLESIVCNSELEWINPADTGDLTDAPMLGILGEEGLKDYTVFLENYGLVVTGCDGHNTLAQPILERWAFMDYQVRSVLEDLRDNGEVVFVNGQ